ncbi:MAG: hypothetical protein U1F34_08780 [Gammaproteobacteria bacterium]
MDYWIAAGISACALLGFGLHGWLRGKAVEVKESDENRRIRDSLTRQEAAFRREVDLLTLELKARERLLDQTRHAFQSGYVNGRRWLAHFISEADKAMDEVVQVQLRGKRRDVQDDGSEVARLQAERRMLKERLNFLEYQLGSYKEYFPFLEDYENSILDEAVQLQAHAGERVNPMLKLLSSEEIKTLPVVERDQLALDRYLRSGLTPAAVAALYDRYVAYLYERDGWEVRFQPVTSGVKGLPQDLICVKGETIHIVHTRCWAANKLIHEKHIIQLYGTVQMLAIRLSEDRLFAPKIVARFITNTKLSDLAKQAAARLKVEVKENFKLNANFPVIKCSVDDRTRERSYYLPFDEEYDSIPVETRRGECYVRTVKEAEQLGFRRANLLPVPGGGASGSSSVH